jgi:hypothetical protein
MKIPVVKEHGSWVVSALSFVAGFATGAASHRAFPDAGMLPGLLTLAGLALLINSKSPMASLLKGARTGKSLAWFLVFTVSGCLLLFPFMLNGFRSFVIFSPLLLLYVILLYGGRERNLLTELTGFSLLTLPAPVAYFVATGSISYRLYLAVFIYFAAGVFKVRATTRRDAVYRLLMVFYCAVCPVTYFILGLPVIVLLPLLENVFSAIWTGERPLSMIGNTEFAKGIIFVVLLIMVWK